MSRIAALLLAVGGRAFFDSAGVMQCVVPANQSGSADYSYGTNDEVLAAEYGDGVVMPNVIRVVGSGAAAQSAQLVQAGSLGRRLVRTVVDLHLDSAAECTDMANRVWDRGLAADRAGWLSVHLNPGQELLGFVGLRIRGVG